MIIVMLGPPGSGKGTQAERLCERLNLIKISTGDILRNEAKQNSELGRKVKSILEQGKYVSDDIMIEIISNRISQDNAKAGFILDGFPRTLNQAQELDKLLDNNQKLIDFVFKLEVDKNVVVSRVTGRIVCENCGETYNEKYKLPQNKGICDICGSTNIVHRNDDTESTILNRLDTYYESTEVLVNYYSDKGILYTINGNEDIDKVTNQINMIVLKSVA